MIDRRRFFFASTAVVASMACGAERSASRLLLVHGRAQQGKDPKSLKKAWLEAFGKGLKKAGKSLPASLRVEFPFYGDVLDEWVRQSNLPTTSDIRTRGSEPDDKFLAFEAEMAEAMRVGSGISEAEVDAEYGANPKPKGPQNWEWVQAILRTLDKKKNFTQASLEKFMRDVYLYISSVTVRESIDALVAKELTGEPTVVVGHSLGSVVAYSVLLRDKRRLQIPLYATVGSPLALRPIRRILEPLEYPRGLQAWYNAFDQRDVVALYPLDAANFAVEPEIENYSGVRNGTDNRHGIDGYLDDKQIAQRILQAL